MKTLINILFSYNFGMQISAKIWDCLKNNLPRSNINIDKDTIYIKFWNANIGNNLGLFKKIIKI